MRRRGKPPLRRFALRTGPGRGGRVPIRTNGSKRFLFPTARSSGDGGPESPGPGGRPRRPDLTAAIRRVPDFIHRQSDRNHPGVRSHRAGRRHVRRGLSNRSASPDSSSRSARNRGPEDFPWTGSGSTATRAYSPTWVISMRGKTSVRSLTQARYEEHSILKSYTGLPRQLDIQSGNDLDGGRTAGPRASRPTYNSTGLWNARFSADRRLREDRGHVRFDLAFNKPLGPAVRGLAGDSIVPEVPKGGSLNVYRKNRNPGAEIGGPRLHPPARENASGFALNSRYSRLRLGAAGGTSNIFTGNLSLSYDAARLTAAAEYYLNRDLVGDSRLSRPQLRFGLGRFPFTAAARSLDPEHVPGQRHVTDPGRPKPTATTRRLISPSDRFPSAPNLSLQFAASLEQFLEKEGRNFTSGGGIFRAIFETHAVRDPRRFLQSPIAEANPGMAGRGDDRPGSERNAPDQSGRAAQRLGDGFLRSQIGRMETGVRRPGRRS